MTPYGTVETRLALSFANISEISVQRHIHIYKFIEILYMKNGSKPLAEANESPRFPSIICPMLIAVGTPLRKEYG